MQSEPRGSAMLSVSETSIHGSCTRSFAERHPEESAWKLSWRSGRYDRNQAISAMMAQEYRAQGCAGDRMVAVWEAELEEEPNL